MGILLATISSAWLGETFTVCAKKKSADDRFKEIRNGKANHNYFVEDRLEAGIELKGTEVKAVRDGDAQISEGFCRIEKGQCWLYNSHIGEYKFGNFQNHPPLRKRRLLLHRREIHKLFWRDGSWRQVADPIADVCETWVDQN